MTAVKAVETIASATGEICISLWCGVSKFAQDLVLNVKLVQCQENLKRKDEIREKCSKIYDVRLVSCRNERPSQSKGACQNSGTLPRSQNRSPVSTGSVCRRLPGVSSVPWFSWAVLVVVIHLLILHDVSALHCGPTPSVGHSNIKVVQKNSKLSKPCKTL